MRPNSRSMDALFLRTRLSSSRKRGSIFSSFGEAGFPLRENDGNRGKKIQVLCHSIISKKTAPDLCEVSKRHPYELASKVSIFRFCVRTLRILSIANETRNRSFRLPFHQRKIANRLADPDPARISVAATQRQPRQIQLSPAICHRSRFQEKQSWDWALCRLQKLKTGMSEINEKLETWSLPLNS